MSVGRRQQTGEGQLRLRRRVEDGDLDRAGGAEASLDRQGLGMDHGRVRELHVADLEASTRIGRQQGGDRVRLGERERQGLLGEDRQPASESRPRWRSRAIPRSG